MTLQGLSPAAIATAEMRAVFTDSAAVQAMLDVEAALARAQALPPDVTEAIGAAADASLYDLGTLGPAALRAGTAAIPMLAALTAEVMRRNPAAAGFVHVGATSQDIVDTGFVLQLRRAVALVAAQGAALQAALHGLTVMHANTPMLGRTLMQPGPPITFGLKTAGWLGAISRGLARLREAAGAALILQFGGAVGTLASLGDAGPAGSSALAAELGLTLPDAPWHAHRDRMVSLAAAAAILGGSLGKMARDIVLLSQAEIAEVAEPGGDGRGGSSAMPQKRNPVACMVTLAATQRMPGLLSGLVDGLAGEHERAAGAWQAEAPAIAELFLALSGALAAMVEAASGLRVDTARMRANIDAQRGTVLAERLATALARTHGRHAAHRLTEHLVTTMRPGLTLHDAAAADPTVSAALSSDELARLFDPLGYLGSAGHFIDRILQSEETGHALRPS